MDRAKIAGWGLGISEVSYHSVIVANTNATPRVTNLSKYTNKHVLDKTHVEIVYRILTKYNMYIINK